MSNDVIVLIKKITGTTNDVGDVIVTKEERTVFCEVKSVGRSEFYQGMAKGYKPEYVFVIENYEDYNDEEVVRYNNKDYKVLKAYRKDAQIELTCYGGVLSNVNT